MDLFVPIVSYTRIESRPYRVTTPTGQVLEGCDGGRHQFTTKAGQVLELHHDRELTEEDHRNAALCLAWAASGLQYSQGGLNR
jgi:hypothetical protein